MWNVDVDTLAPYDCAISIQMIQAESTVIKIHCCTTFARLFNVHQVFWCVPKYRTTYSLFVHTAMTLKQKRQQLKYQKNDDAN